MSPSASRRVARSLRASVGSNPYRALAAGLAIAAGIAVFAIAHELFPYHSSNHDEGVYLQQAAMLLDGRLFLTPGGEALRDAFRPWFFVEGARGLYPRYTPVPAALFALGELAGGYRLTLGAVAAANVSLTYVLAAAAFDRRTGATAAAVLAIAPLFLVSSAVFLPYAPTTALNLLFAAAYVRSHRAPSWRWASVAGGAIGLAFFSRPYTALLFAAPFVAHALWRLSREPGDRSLWLRTGLTAGVGLAFVGVALGYNAVVTGSALRFPYEAFAPRDGLGFGRRAILDHEVHYTPSLALRANAHVLWTFATGWFTAGLLGTAAAVAGLGLALVGLRRHGLDRAVPMGRRQLQLLMVGVVGSVVVGNVYFWGNLNVLADLSRPGDGLISRFGPFYHFDLLAPLAAFAAAGGLAAVDRARARLPTDRPAARLVVAVLAVVALAAVGAAQADALGPPVERNAAYTAKYERADAPIEGSTLDGALVLLPSPYGPWLNHPFQWLRNDPGLDGPTVYALSLAPATDFAVLDAYPRRAYLRYRHHGRWTPDPADHVVPVLEPIRPVADDVLVAETRVAVPERIVAVSVAVTNGEAVRRYDLTGPVPRTLSVVWIVGRDGVSVAHPRLRPGDAGEVPRVTGPDRVALLITLTEPGGATLTYREEVAVRPTATGVEAIWPPETTVCPLVTECGAAGTYLPDRPESRPNGIATNTTLVGPLADGERA